MNHAVNSQGAQSVRANPGSETSANLYRRLQERMQSECPGWQGRPEDPARVLLELWAQVEAELRGELSSLEEVVFQRLLEALAIEPRGPAPARGVVRFSAAAGSLSRVCQVPAGTRITAPRRPGEPRLLFETVADCWVGENGRTVAPFSGEKTQSRFLFLGDHRLAVLQNDARPLVLEWPQAPIHLADLEWSYSAAGGWRPLFPQFEVAETDGGVLLRMVIQGPLLDMAESPLEHTKLPWIRAELTPREQLSVRVPTLRTTEEELDSPRVSRFFAESEGILRDFSFETQELTLKARPKRLDPTILLGFDAAGPFSLHLRLKHGGSSDEESAPESEPLWRWNPRPPSLQWEVSTADDWAPLQGDEIQDRTDGLQRSGSIQVSPRSAWASRELFNESLFWLRATWQGGSYMDVPSVESVDLDCVEVVQGMLLRDQPLMHVGQDWSGWVEAPDFPEGVADLFDHLTVQVGEERQRWERAASLEGVRPGDHRFVLRRRADGRLLVRFDHGEELPPPPENALISIDRVRVGIGAFGNLPTETLDRLETGLDFISGVRQPVRTSQGRDVEPIVVLRRRPLARWLNGERAVTEEDYRSLVETVLPQVERVEVLPDPVRPGGVQIVIVSPESRHSPLDPPVLEALQCYLADKTVPGVSVRVCEGSLLEATLMLNFRRAPGHLQERSEAQLDELGGWAAGEIRTTFGGIKTTLTRSGKLATDSRAPLAILPLISLKTEPLKNLFSRVLTGRKELKGMEIKSARLVSKDGREIIPPRGENASAFSDVYVELRSVELVFDG